MSPPARRGPASYALAVEEKPGYLHFVVTGANTRENVMRYMDEVMRECRARGCRRILIEERLEGARLGTMDVFEMVSAGSTRFRGVLQALAYVDVNAAGGLMDFAEDVAVNRGFPVRAFATTAAAEEWLRARRG
ncbi:MAG TPA: hypothetical protein VEU54_00855 [Steroidobacteraceae bacterium]|jgi:hypothetical protein|nr:hypothetical protein [Steroidobacteraceae bacterium]